MCRICFTADITDDAPAASTSFTNFMNCNSKAVGRSHPTAHHRRAISTHDHAVIRPAGRREVERSGAHMRLELGRTTEERAAERFRVHSAPPNENGQATPCTTVSVESGVDRGHQE